MDQSPDSKNKKLFCWLLMLCICFMSRNLAAQVIINEIMASNVSVYPDIWDFEDFSDWIELHNTSNSEVDLTGFYLTDNFKDLKKWPVPDGTRIAPKGYLVIFADGNDAKPGERYTRDSYPWNEEFTTKYYHTNFGLGVDGEEIALCKNANGTVSIVDSVIFANQLNDISYGRYPDAETAWYQFDLPTPGAANTSDPKRTEVPSASVSFSVPGGFYDGAQSVTLSCSAGEIYYTLDGSIPNKNSRKYSSPIDISKTTTIRARCMESDKLAGKVATNTYFINEKSRKLMCISIAADSTLLFDKDKGVFENSLKGRELPIAIEFFTEDGQQIAKANAGMRIGSLTNFTCPQKPLQIALKGGKYGDDFIWYRLFNKQFGCFAEFRLRQGGDGWSSNMITDGMLESICKDQLELGTQAYRPVVLFLNGSYYGIHDLREQFDDQYFMNNYNIDPSGKDEVRSILLPPDGDEGWELVSGSWDSWNSLLNLVRQGSMTDAQKYNEVKSMVNINSLIDFVCIQEFGCNVSWGHNEDVWKTAGSKWQWLVTDFDRCFTYSGFFSNVRTDVLNDGGGGLSSSIIKQDTLFTCLLKNSEFKNHFVQRFAAHLNSTFKPSRLNSIVDSIVEILSPEMEEYTKKWAPEGGIKSIESWHSSVDSVKRFIDERAEYVFEHLSSSNFAGTETAELTVKLSIEGAGELLINQVKMNQDLSEMPFFKSIPMQLKAVAKPGYVFAGWQEGPLTDTMTLTLNGDKVLTANFEVSEKHPVSETISKSTTLNLTDNPYVASGNIFVPAGVTLTIEKGVKLLMPQDADIMVEGKLLIKGTAESPVSIKPNIEAGATNWGALTFTDAIDTSKLSYLEISGTTLGDDPVNERGGVNGNNSNVVMDHLTVTDVIYPFYFEGGNTVLRNSHITIDHICNGGIHIGRGGALVENNTWVSTGKTINTDAIDIKGVTDGTVRGNRLYNFNGFNSDGIDLGENCKNVLIEGNYIYGNRDKGISCGGNSTCTVRNNIIVACDLGIGIKDEGSKAELDHNTFVRNRIAIAAYTKVFGRGGGIANVKNCILAGSKGASIYKDQFSTVTLSYCISDVDLLPGTGNRYGDPLFADLINNNFELKSGSPCINNGSPESPKDSDGSITDIGAPYKFDPLDFPKDVAPPYLPSVVINEVMSDDKKDSPEGDWIELHNTTGKDISLGNWKLCDKGDIFYWENLIEVNNVDSSDLFIFPSNTVLKAGQYLVVCRELDLFKAARPQVENCIGGLTFGLNGEDVIFLFDDKDSLVNLVNFSVNAPWPETDNGSTIGLRNPKHLNHLPQNWSASEKRGTPGTANGFVAVFHQRGSVIPAHFYLGQNFPNPFRTSTTIKFGLPEEQVVQINVYNIAGRLMERLVNKRLPAGVHRVVWDARRYSPGLYFYSIKAGKFNKTRKFTVQ